MILGIDPGPVESGWCELLGQRIVGGGRAENDPLLGLLGFLEPEGDRNLAAIETMSGSYGNQSVGLDVIQTAIWIGRFAERWDFLSGRRGQALLIPRKTVVTHLTGNPRANDSHVRQALIDLWGGNAVALARRRVCPECRGKGTRKQQPCEACGSVGRVGEDGPLLGVTSHQWSALAVAVAARDGVGA